MNKKKFITKHKKPLTVTAVVVFSLFIISIIVYIATRSSKLNKTDFTLSESENTKLQKENELLLENTVSLLHETATKFEKTAFAMKVFMVMSFIDDSISKEFARLTVASLSETSAELQQSLEEGKISTIIMENDMREKIHASVPVTELHIALVQLEMGSDNPIIKSMSDASALYKVVFKLNAFVPKMVDNLNKYKKFTDIYGTLDLSLSYDKLSEHYLSKKDEMYKLALENM